MKNFVQIKKNLKKDYSGFKEISIAVLGDSATQLLVQAIRGYGFEYNYDLNILEADYNQVERQVFSNNSELYSFSPEVVIIFKSTQKLLEKYNKSFAQQQLSFAENELNLIEQVYSNLTNQLKTKVIFYNYSEIDDFIFGNYANKVEQSFLFQLRKLNYKLMQFAVRNSDFYICDMSSMQNQIGKKNLFQSSIYINNDIVTTIDALPLIAARTIDIIASLYGRFKKCLILDLDNTLWGGVIGDDGIENIEIGNLGIGKAFTEFQHWIKKLKDRGIILAVCSKNTESIAKEPFDKHPDMVLKLDDFSVFMANWNNKVDNIREIQQILNIGFDSMVFLDDNPFERNMVKENIKDIFVPELPEDPAEYLEYLYALNLFETTSYSIEDGNRTRQYQTEAKRVNLKNTFTNEDDFLKSLNMISLVENFNNFNTPRIAQLTQRSNQFNLRTIRYTEEDIQKFSQSKNHIGLTFSLDDKFGQNGLISVLIIEKESNITWVIDTWIMSCRVLKRGMENFILNTLVSNALENGINHIKGEYLPTDKNGIVKNLYKDLGFSFKENHWTLAVVEYKNKKCYIKKHKDDQNKDS